MAENQISNLEKIRLLLWKNWLIQSRKKKQFLLEVILSLLFCILLIVIRDLADSDRITEPSIYKPFEVSKLPEDLKESYGFSLSKFFYEFIMDQYVEGDEIRKKRSILQEDHLKSNIRSEPGKPPTQKFSVRKKRQDIFGNIFNPAWPLAFAPNNSAVKLIMDHLSTYLHIDTSEDFGFATEEEMEAHLTTFSMDGETQGEKLFGLDDILGGVVFMNEFPNDTIPENIIYKIRLKSAPRSAKKKIAFEPAPTWNTEIIYPVFQIPGPRNNESNEGGRPGYYDDGFLSLQYAIDRSIALTMNGTPIENFADLKMQRMPYPPYIDDKYLVALQSWLPLILLLSFLYPAVNVVKSVVYEKELKLKESMKMMGLSNWLHWFAWFVKSLIMLLITSVLVTLLLCTRWNGSESLAVLDNSDPTVVFFFLFLYSCASVSFCFFMSTLFSKANGAATAAGFLWMFSYPPNIFIRPRFLMISMDVKMGLCLYFNMAMSLGCFLTSMLEGTGSGLQWNLITRGVSPDSPFSMGHIFIMLVVDTLFYAILTWYIEGVFPGEFGVPQPIYFPFLKSYWCGPQAVKEDSEMIYRAPNIEFFEEEQRNLKPGIIIEGLTKVFAKNKIAVKNMHLNVNKGQITVLLGHNGAGKTTTMAMLTGLFPPTRGTARINGYDIIRDIDAIRCSLGICPQHDVLFDELTVSEHIIFFSMLKGFKKKDAKKEVRNLLNAVQLMPKINELSTNLSGGMKRKLSVAISLCAGSKVVILDEPTTGMDPGARRVIWDLLQRERQDRTILLTTHFMEEADLLGDRIAIMSNGLIQCCGSSLFLKNIYGAGYHLTFVKDKMCDVERITKLIHNYIPQANLELNVAAELTYTLPTDSVTKFDLLFNELEKSKNELHISSYGASQTTMEEVFLKVGEETIPDVPIYPEHVAGSVMPNQHNDEAVERSSLLQESIEYIELGNIQSKSNGELNGTTLVVDKEAPRLQSQRNTGLALMCQHFYAMIVKKAINTFRNLIMSIALILIPIMFLLIVMVILRNIPGVSDNPPSHLATLNDFDGTTTTYMRHSNREISSMFESYYKDNFNIRNELIFLSNKSNLDDYLLDKASEDLPAFNLHWMTAIKVKDVVDSSKMQITAFFNNQPYHISPIALNLVSQSLVQMSTNNPNVTIFTYNHPLPKTDTEKLTQESRSNMGFNVGFNLAFGLSFLCASFILFLVKERESNSKHLQIVSGVNLFLFWLANVIWDTLFFMLSVIIIIFCLYQYQEPGLCEPEQLARIALILVLYCWAMLPLMYIFSFAFDIPSTGYIRMALINMFTGMATLITVAILRIPDLYLTFYADVFDWVFLTFPPYSMASAISELYSNVRSTKICNRNIVYVGCTFSEWENPCCPENCGPFGCVKWTEDIFRWESLGIGRMVVFLFIEGFIYYFILALIELQIFRTIKYSFMSLYAKAFHGISAAAAPPLDEDDDVRAEKSRIQNTPLDEIFKKDHLLIKNLGKTYRNGVVAVDKISVGVPLGECFGLLGINGAGKTTTFKMLTGDIPISSGEAFISGYSVKDNIKMVQKIIGYCPQFDAVFEHMTGRETLYMYARLRGIPERKINKWIQKITDHLLLSTHLDKLVGNYSGGNKRKLSTAIALIGDPSIIFLDEPTSGMDPVARRHLWNVLNNIRDEGRSIILTSHSMEECEALCTRLAIMTNGSFLCIGSSQHLKSKFSEGYSVTIRVKIEDRPSVHTHTQMVELLPEMRSVHQFISQSFFESVLRESHYGQLEYFIPQSSASWSQVFGLLEENKHTLNIEDYSVTQTTLERVFLNFTRPQMPEVT